jgi:hypothetical protein
MAFRQKRWLRVLFKKHAHPAQEEAHQVFVTVLYSSFLVYNYHIKLTLLYSLNNKLMERKINRTMKYFFTQKGHRLPTAFQFLSVQNNEPIYILCKH